MTPESQALLNAAVAEMMPIVSAFGYALAAALGGWLLTMLPSPIRSAVRDALASATHARDQTLLANTMAVGAIAQTAKTPPVVTPAGAVLPPPTPDSVGALLEFIRAELPELLVKMHKTDQALHTQAVAALQTARAAYAGPERRREDRGRAARVNEPGNPGRASDQEPWTEERRAAERARAAGRLAEDRQVEDRRTADRKADDSRADDRRAEDRAEEDRREKDAAP